MHVVHNKTAKLSHLALGVFRAGRDYLESSGKTAVLTSLTNIEKKTQKGILFIHQQVVFLEI